MIRGDLAVIMGQAHCTNPKLKGGVASEAVREIFEENFEAGREDTAQLCVYVGEEVGVDVWDYSTDTNYDRDTLNTKSLSTICMAMLYDQGLIKY